MEVFALYIIVFIFYSPPRHIGFYCIICIQYYSVICGPSDHTWGGPMPRFEKIYIELSQADIELSSFYEQNLSISTNGKVGWGFFLQWISTDSIVVLAECGGGGALDEWYLVWVYLQRMRGEGGGWRSPAVCIQASHTYVCMCVLHIGAICTYTVVYNIYRNTCTKWTNQPHVIVHRVTGT